MPADLYPAGEDGYPAANYLLADDAVRPRFGRAGEIPSRPGSDPAIVVIGAGYVGLSAALHLAELQRSSGAPAHIVLLEQGRVASGPSGKSAGHICGLQASDEVVRRVCGPELGERLIAAAAEASQLVRRLIGRHAIPCDLRDGYVVIQSDGRQTVIEGGPGFGIDAYPFALGLAYAASALGVEIREGVTVTGLQGTSEGCIVTTTDGVIPAALVLASGGHRMAEAIELLAPLRRRTTELRVSTVMTDPLPDEVLRRAMPAAAGRRWPFSNDSADVAYGSIDRSNRLIFGACATGFGEPDPERIMLVLARLLPSLLPDYRAATGKALAWRPLVVAERLCFTRNCLPNVGVVAGHPNILFVHALGGHGLAIGTLLGRAAAEKLWRMRVGDGTQGALFDAFAAVPHGWMPASQPWRSLVASLGLRLGGGWIQSPLRGTESYRGP
jgi:gamma-glutamylputrescine oxidase